MCVCTCGYPSIWDKILGVILSSYLKLVKSNKWFMSWLRSYIHITHPSYELFEMTDKLHGTLHNTKKKNMQERENICEPLYIVLEFYDEFS